MSSASYPYTDYSAANLDTSTCGLGSPTWTVNGPATSYSDKSVSDATVNSWLSVSGLNLVVSIPADPNAVTFDGAYTITHANG